MNKWFLFGATIMMFLAFGYTLPITIRNPVGSNLVISGILAIMTISGLWTFFKAKKQQEPDTIEINGRKVIPVE